LRKVKELKMANARPYQICSQCVMDTSDPHIIFTEDGKCSHCSSFPLHAKQHWFKGNEGIEKLNRIISEIKDKNKQKKYDCIIGLSGGADSSYLAYWAAKHANLRLLAVHVDAGWNSEIAVSNIKKIVSQLNIDLITHVIDWEEMADLQRSFLNAGVANQDTPQDHAFFAALYHFANKNNIQYILSGFNFASESILPKGWGHSAMDLEQIKDIHKKFGRMKLRTFPLISFFKNYIYYPYVKKMRIIFPLNYITYIKSDAIMLLNKELGWEDYGGKHCESRFTKFFQSYFLPTRFGFDKRRAHLSSLVLSGQIDRHKALKILEKPPFEEDKIHLDKEFVCRKLSVSMEEFNEFLNMPKRDFTYYKNNSNKMWLLNLVRYVLSLPGTAYKRFFSS